MRNMWIGLVIGAATGAAIGAVADSASAAGRKVQEVDVQAKAHDLAVRVGQSPVGEAGRQVGHALADTARAAENFAKDHAPGTE